MNLWFSELISGTFPSWVEVYNYLLHIEGWRKFPAQLVETGPWLQPTLSIIWLPSELAVH